MLRLLSGICLVALGTACGPRVIYEEEMAVAEPGWAYDDVAAFAFPVADTAVAYDLTLTLEHAPEFPYQNFYVRLYTELPAGVTDTQQLSLQLAGDFGSWLGDCTANACTIDVPILTNVRYRAPGRYGLRVAQYSRDNPLPGIRGLGLRVAEAE